MTKANGWLGKVATALLLVAMLSGGDGARTPRPTPRRVDAVCVTEVL